MKKLWLWTHVYVELGLVLGIASREITRSLGHDSTALGVLHTHSFVLGFFVFAFLMILEKVSPISKSKFFNRFLVVYNVGVLWMLTMLFVRGLTEAMDLTLDPLWNGTISWVSGFAHITLLVGFIFLLRLIKESLLVDKSAK